MIGLIIGSGEIKNYNVLIDLAKTADYVICADGGANHLINIGINPDLVVGDLDSIDENTLKNLKETNVEINKFPKEKDYTDTELAIKYLMDKKVDKIILVGVTGSRFDHTLANIFLLRRLLEKGIEGQILSHKNTIYITDKKFVLEKEEGYFVSIIPLNDEGAVVTLKGFKYETDKEEFSFSSTYGISNKIIEKRGIIEIHKGTCLVIVSKD
ncbi:MAG TPA: thiamine diphosphokinase [Tissierellales bacterium]|nr:thiamine diphosphokinase [Tissierellales bacterium]